MKERIQALRGQRGFTLIELLVVIVIIGVLIGLAVPVVTSYLERGRDTDRKADINLIADALEHHYTDNGTYPDTVYGNTDLQNNYNNGDAFPTDPQGDTQYTYTPLPDACTTDCQGFELSATLENDQDQDTADGSDQYIVESRQSSA